MKWIQYNLPAILVPALLILVLTGTAQAQESTVEAQIKTAETDTIKTEAEVSKSEQKQVSEKKNIVEFDFKKKSIKTPDKIKFHDFYFVKIKNINLNLYDVKVNNKDSTVTSGVKFPSFDSIVLDGISDLIENLAPLGLKFNNKSISIHDTSTTITTSIPDPVTVLMMDKKEELVQINNNLEDIARNIDNLALSVQTLSLSYLAVDSTLNKKLKKDFSYGKILEDSKTYREEIDRVSKKLITSEKEYREFSNKYSDYIQSQSDSTLIKFDKEIKDLYAKTAGNVGKVFAGINAEKVGGWLSSLIFRENNSSGVYKSQPFQITGDFSVLTVNITPKSEDYGLPSFENTYHLPKPPRFYIGGGASFYYSWNMRNDAFSISSTKIDSVTTEYTLVDEKQPRGEIGIASVIQFGWALRDNRRGNFHLTVGPAASIGKTIKPRLLTGVGFAYGRKQKVWVSGGFLMGQVDRLSEAFDTETVYTEKPGEVVVSKFLIRGALSVGYIFNF